jgi:hypothetical protein
MKTGVYCQCMAVIILLLGAAAPGQVDTTRPTGDSVLTGMDQVYFFVYYSRTNVHKAELAWDVIEFQAKGRLNKAGVKALPEKQARPSMKSLDVPELKAGVEVFKLQDTGQYLVRTQTSLWRAARPLSGRSVMCIAEVWRTEPNVQLISEKDLHKRTGDTIIQQVDTFIKAYLTANPKGAKAVDVNGPTAAETRKEKASDKTDAIQYSFVASKNSKVFHKPTCRSARSISAANLVTYKTRDEALAAGKQPCKTCKP